MNKLPKTEVINFTLDTLNILDVAPLNWRENLYTARHITVQNINYIHRLSYLISYPTNVYCLVMKLHCVVSNVARKLTLP